VRDLRGILQSIAEQGMIESDSVMLTEHVAFGAEALRLAQVRAASTNTLIVYLLDPQIEEAVRGAIKRTSAGNPPGTRARHRR